ncbi:MAG: glycosyltransferase 87 family protein [Candidatus Sumerlaeia bacterium]|nr:glycosyltransferase 87 family protein [Candidatus Sumerlaeia bacterium]
MRALPRWQRAAFALLILLYASFLPFGRGPLHDVRRPGVEPRDQGSIWAPLSVDAGYLIRHSPGLDFYSIYNAGSRVLAGLDPYGSDADPPLRAPYKTTFRYLPVTAYWLGVPLNALPPEPAWKAWVALLWLMPVAGFLACAGRRPGLLWVFALLWFCWFPLVPEFHLGQFTLFMATLLFWFALRLFEGGRLAGAAWVLGALVKVYPLGFALLLWSWGRRRAVVVAFALAVPPLAYFAATPSGLSEGLGGAGVRGRLVGAMDVPYAGAQGVQALVNVLAWKAQGLAMLPPGGFERLAPGRDPVAYASAAIILLWGALCVWAWWRTRRAPDEAALAIFWLTWFVVFRDAWEHHTALVQALAAFLLVRGRISARLALLVWCAAGAPSLWYFWQKAGYTGNILAESLGVAYFVQRPVATLALAAAMVASLRRIHPAGPGVTE